MSKTLERHKTTSAVMSSWGLFAAIGLMMLGNGLLGTLLGMVPGIAAMAVFAEGIVALVRDADLKQFLVAALALAFIVGLMLLARRLFNQIAGRGE